MEQILGLVAHMARLRRDSAARLTRQAGQLTAKAAAVIQGRDAMGLDERAP